MSCGKKLSTQQRTDEHGDFCPIRLRAGAEFCVFHTSVHRISHSFLPRQSWRYKVGIQDQITVTMLSIYKKNVLKMKYVADYMKRWRKMVDLFPGWFPGLFYTSNQVAWEPRGILYVEKKLQITAAEWKRRFLGKFMGGKHGKKGASLKRKNGAAGAGARNGGKKKNGASDNEGGGIEKLTEDEQLAKLYETDANVYENMPMAECPPGIDLHFHQRKGLHWMLQRETTSSIGPHWKIHTVEKLVTVNGATGAPVNLEQLMAANPMPQPRDLTQGQKIGGGHASYIRNPRQKEREAELEKQRKQAWIQHQRDVVKKHNVVRKSIAVPTGKASYDTGMEGTKVHDVAAIPVPRGGIVADEMGLGKTRQMIAVIAKNVKPYTLVVAPAAVVYDVWKAELTYQLLQNEELTEKMGAATPRPQNKPTEGKANTSASASANTSVFMSALLEAQQEREDRQPPFKLYVYHGQKKEMPAEEGKSDSCESEPNLPTVTITSYETLVSKAAEFKKRRWSRLILDEAHEVRNKNCKAFKVLAEIVGGGNRNAAASAAPGGPSAASGSSNLQLALAGRGPAVAAPQNLQPHHEIITWLLTATPFVNKIDDLYPLFSLLRVKPLDDYSVWRANISCPAGEIIEAGLPEASMNAEQEAKNVGKYKGLERANLLLREFMLRRRKNDRVVQPGAKAASWILQLPEKRCFIVKLPFATKEAVSSLSQEQQAQTKKFNDNHAKMYANLWRFATTEVVAHQTGATAIVFVVIAKLRQLSLSPMLLPKSWREVLVRGDVREMVDLILPKPKDKKDASGASSAKQNASAAAGAVVKVKKGQRFEFKFGENYNPQQEAGAGDAGSGNGNESRGRKKQSGKTVAEIFNEHCVDEDCSICQEAFAPDDGADVEDPNASKKIVCLTPCGHVFHETCVEASFAQLRRECPLCRHAIPETQYKFYLERPSASQLDGVGGNGNGNGSSSSKRVLNKHSVVEQLLDKPEELAEFDAAPKVQKILELIRRSTGPVLVFSSFKQFLLLLRQSVDAKLKMGENGSNVSKRASSSAAPATTTEILCGGLPPKRRSQIVKSFQAGETKVLFCSLRASGVGLTLTKAKTVILAEPHWNSPIEEQAIARAHRLGLQHRINVYRLVMTNEETASGDNLPDPHPSPSASSSGNGSPSASSSSSSSDPSDSDSDSRYTSDSAVGGPEGADDFDDSDFSEDEDWEIRAEGPLPGPHAATGAASSSSKAAPASARPGLAAGMAATAALSKTSANSAANPSIPTPDISAAATAYDKLTLEERMLEVQKRKQEHEQVSADTKMKKEEMADRQQKMMNSLMLDLLRGPTIAAGGGKRLQPWEIADDGMGAGSGIGSGEEIFGGQQSTASGGAKRARRN